MGSTAGNEEGDPLEFYHYYCLKAGNIGYVWVQSSGVSLGFTVCSNMGKNKSYS